MFAKLFVFAKVFTKNICNRQGFGDIFFLRKLSQKYIFTKFFAKICVRQEQMSLAAENLFFILTKM